MTIFLLFPVKVLSFGKCFRVEFRGICAAVSSSVSVLVELPLIGQSA